MNDGSWERSGEKVKQNMMKNQCKCEVSPEQVRNLGDLVMRIKKKIISVVIREREAVTMT